MTLTSVNIVASAGGGLELNPWLAILIGILLVLINGFFVATEFALVKVRPTQIDPYVARGDRRGKIARSMVDNLDAYLSASQIGITLASLALGWVGEPAFAWLLSPLERLLIHIPGMTESIIHSLRIVLAFSIITVLHVVVGELAPKTLAIRKPEPTALWTSIPMWIFFKATYPLMWLLNLSSSTLLSWIGLKPASEHEMAHDEEELRQMLANPRSTRLSEQKRDLLDNVFELSRRVARQVMVPRGDVVFLSTHQDLDTNLKLARESGHTRFPLCEGDLDRVFGMIHIKDLFRATSPLESLRQVSRPIAMVPETLNLDRLLKRMRAERMHFAAVLDEYGGVSGIVTLENVIEEIVGDIQDEFDAERPEIVEQGEGVYQISGAVLILELEDELGIEISDRDDDTVGGLVLSELGRLPEVGERVVLSSISLEVLEVADNRILQLRVKVPRESTETSDSKE